MLAAVLVLAWPQIGAAPSPSRQHGCRARSSSGLLVAAATLVREVAPFTIPVLLIYLSVAASGLAPVRRVRRRRRVPLLAYSALIDHRFHVFGLTATPGWTLYGRVAGFADCAGIKLEPAARPLCETAAQRTSHPTRTRLVHLGAVAGAADLPPGHTVGGRGRADQQGARVVLAHDDPPAPARFRQRDAR